MMKDPEIESENEYIAISINDGSKDYYLRLSKLVPECNVIQLKQQEQVQDGRKLIDLGHQTNSIMVQSFMDRAKDLNLEIELRVYY